jgi:hypothetical protein
MPDKHICAWCQYPGSKHQGGYRKSNGTEGTEWFCNMEHFDLWLKWQAMLAPIKEQSHLTKFAVRA